MGIESAVNMTTVCITGMIISISRFLIITLEPVPDGEMGEIVITTLVKRCTSDSLSYT